MAWPHSVFGSRLAGGCCLPGRLIPKSDSSEFFGFYNILGKFSAILGPVLVGLATQWTGNSRWGIFSLVILFVIGLVIFLILPRLNDVKP